MNIVLVAATGPKGLACEPVEHISYVFRQPNPFAYGHHRLDRTAEPGRVYQCGICYRWVFRGQSRWWE